MLKTSGNTAYSELSDEELAIAAQSGDREAEYALVVRFMGLVKLKARPYFLVGADRADLIQEGSIGLIAAVRDYDCERGGSFRSFAETCITRQMFPAIKAATRKKHLPLNNYVSLDKSAYSNSESTDSTLVETLVLPKISNPEEIILDREEYRNFGQKLEKTLTELERKVLVLFLRDKSYAEIAETLGKSTKSVDNAIQRVKKKVSALLKDMSEE